MTCPVCGEKTTVTESRDFGDHVIRRRKCLACSYVFCTEEVDSESVEAELSEFHKNYNQARKG